MDEGGNLFRAGVFRIAGHRDRNRDSHTDAHREPDGNTNCYADAGSIKLGVHGICSGDRGYPDVVKKSKGGISNGKL